MQAIITQLPYISIPRPRPRSRLKSWDQDQDGKQNASLTSYNMIALQQNPTKIKQTIILSNTNITSHPFCEISIGSHKNQTLKVITS